VGSTLKLVPVVVMLIPGVVVLVVVLVVVYSETGNIGAQDPLCVLKMCQDLILSWDRHVGNCKHWNHVRERFRAQKMSS
jgi:hypothetical protein